MRQLAPTRRAGAGDCRAGRASPEAGREAARPVRKFCAARSLYTDRVSSAVPSCVPLSPRTARTARVKPPSVAVNKHPARRALFAVLACVLALPDGFAAGPLVLTLSDGGDPPYTNPDRTGIIDRIAGEAFRRAGLELRLLKLPPERAVLLADRGIMDGDMGRVAGLEVRYKNLIRVPENVTRLEAAAVSRDQTLPASIEALLGRDLGVIQGWKMYEPILPRASHLVTADDTDQLFRLLQFGRVEVILFERWMAHAYIVQHGVQGVQVLEPPLATYDTFIYLHKRHAEHVSRLAAALRDLKREGVYDRVYRDAIRAYAEDRRE